MAINNKRVLKLLAGRKEVIINEVVKILLLKLFARRNIIYHRNMV